MLNANLITMRLRGGRSRRYSLAAVGVVLIAPVNCRNKPKAEHKHIIIKNNFQHADLVKSLDKFDPDNNCPPARL